MQLETAVLIALPPSLLLESQSKPHHAKLNFPTRPLPIPPHGPTEIGGTVQTAFGCIDDILRPTSEHDQLRTSPASELRQNRNTCNSSPHCEAKRQGTAFRLSVARKILRIEY